MLEVDGWMPGSEGGWLIAELLPQQPGKDTYSLCHLVCCCEDFHCIRSKCDAVAVHQSGHGGSELYLKQNNDIDKNT